MMGNSYFTSPFGGEVAPLGAGEGAFSTHRTQTRPPHPNRIRKREFGELRADLSPEGRGEKARSSHLSPKKDY